MLSSNAELPVDVDCKVDSIALSVVIVAYKKIEMVLECINSIYQFNDIGSKLEVILVDNSPDHNVYDAVMSNFDSVIGIKNINNGFGGGNNLGALQARGRYLLFLNPDTVLIESVFCFAIKKFDSNNDLGMFGVKMVSRDLSRNSSFYLTSGASILRSIFMKICNIFDIYLDRYMYIAGANMFVRKKDFLQCGLFDENIFMYYEEPDLTNRLHAIGKYTAYFKDKRIIHLEGGTSSGGELAIRRRFDSAIYFYNKYSLNPGIIFLRELRLNKLKLFICKLFRSDLVADVVLNIKILSEYMKRIHAGK